MQKCGLKHYSFIHLFICSCIHLQKILVHFLNLSSQASIECSSDTVSVYDGESPWGAYCGDTVPPLLQSSGETVNVTFITDATVSGAGFRFRWQHIGESRERKRESWRRLRASSHTHTHTHTHTYTYTQNLHPHTQTINPTHTL